MFFKISMGYEDKEVGNMQLRRIAERFAQKRNNILFVQRPTKTEYERAT